MKKLWYGKLKWLKRIILLGVAAGILALAAALILSAYVKSQASDRIVTQTWAKTN